MAFFNVADYLIEERRRWPVITASHEDNVLLNKFRILKERHVQMRKPNQSPGRMKNSSYYIAPVGDWTHDLPHTVASNMVKVSHALNHSATEAVMTLWRMEMVLFCENVTRVTTEWLKYVFYFMTDRNSFQGSILSKISGNPDGLPRWRIW